MGKIQISCFECRTAMEFTDIISRKEECPKCKADVRCCRNCNFHDPKVYNECKETNADPIREKHRSNLCDYFQPKSGSGSGVKSREDLLKAAESLFKK